MSSVPPSTLPNSFTECWLVSTPTSPPTPLSPRSPVVSLWPNPMDTYQSLPPWPPLCQSTLMNTLCPMASLGFPLASLALPPPLLLPLWLLLLTLLWRLCLLSSTFKCWSFLASVLASFSSQCTCCSWEILFTPLASFTIYHISHISQPRPKVIPHFPTEKIQKAFWSPWNCIPSGMRMKQPKVYFYQLMDLIIHMWI